MKDTKTKILEAAIKLFSQYGYNGASIRQISSEAGVNIAAIHYHYQSKQGLYKALITDYTPNRFVSFSKTIHDSLVFENQKDFVAYIKSFAQLLVCDVFNNLDLFHILEQEIDQGAPLLKDEILKLNQPVVNRLQEVFVQAWDKQWLRLDIDVQTLSIMLMSIIMSPIKQRHLLNRFMNFDIYALDNRQSYYQQAVNIFIDGIIRTGDR